MATQNESSLEDEIDQLRLPRAISRCRENGVDISDNPKLQQIKWRLKRQLLCRNARRQETIESLDWHAHLDGKRRNDLVEIYNNTLDNTDHIMKMEDPIVDELRKCYPDICKLLESEKMKISESKAPILVLGETGSGKSSFINLLLGKNILPCSLLSNTHVICEIRSSNHNNSFAVLDSGDGDPKKIEHDPGNYENFKKELAEAIQAEEDGKPKYKIARIYISSDILHSGVVIVDSPGIGESKDMENLVLDYILNACTFIYIIDSTSAGGMQERMQKLVQKVYKKALDEQKEYRPDSAIFICNKWDEVPFDEREDVWEDTKKKIMKYWPNCSDTQIFKFSTHEASYIQDLDGMSLKFNPVLERISQLVPLGQEILLLRAYKFLDDFAWHCIHCFGTHLHQVQLSAEEREEMRKTIEQRLHAISTKLDSFYTEQQNTLKKEIKAIAKSLGQYLQTQGNKEAVCRFSDSEIPQKTTWNEEAVAVRSIVYEKIMLKIKAWEDENKKFKKLGENIATAIEAEFPKFEGEIFKVQQAMSKTDAREITGPDDEDDHDLVPKFIKNRFRGLKFPMKVAVGIGLAPVLAVSLVVHLPVFGFKTIRRNFQKYKFESKFKKVNSSVEKKTVCEEYANEIVESITDKLSLESIIEEDMQQVFKYLRQQYQKMEMQISSDLNLLKTLKEEERSSEDIIKTYEPLQAKFKILSKRLRHFLFLYIPDRYASRIPYYDIVKSDNLVCSGYWANVYLGETKKPNLTDGSKTIAIRMANGKMEASSVKKHILEQQAYSNIRKKAIAQCFGVCTNEGFHYQILEPLKCSLRNHMTTMKDDLEKNRSSMVIKITREIVDGLSFLHDRQNKLVSLDLSLDTIAVDMSGNIKLTNISLERKLLLMPEYATRMIAVDKYIHFHPCFFNYTTETITRLKMNSSDLHTVHELSDDFSIITHGLAKDIQSFGASPSSTEESSTEESSSEKSSSLEACKQASNDEVFSVDTDAVPSRREHGPSSTFPRSNSAPTYGSTSNQSDFRRHTIPNSSDLSKTLPTGNCTTPYSRKDTYAQTISCSTDTSITRRSKCTYGTRDDMYAVGVLMCDLWSANFLGHMTQHKDIPNEAILANKNGDKYEACGHMEKFMKAFQPQYRVLLEASQIHGLDKDFTEQLWSIILKCFERKMLAKEWLDLMRQILDGSNTLVVYERHYASSPPTY